MKVLVTAEDTLLISLFRVTAEPVAGLTVHALTFASGVSDVANTAAPAKIDNFFFILF